MIVAFLAACGKGDDKAGGDAASPVALRLQAGIEVTGPATGKVVDKTVTTTVDDRTGDVMEVTMTVEERDWEPYMTSIGTSRATAAAWEPGDAIGIYMVEAGSVAVTGGAENRLYTTAAGDGAFTADEANTIYFPQDGTAVDFLAYYPRVAVSADGTFTLDVTDQSDLSSLDLLTARASSTGTAPLDKDHPAVALAFSHRMTSLELAIEAGTGLATADLVGLRVEITGQRVAGNYDPVAGLLGVDATPVETVALAVTPDGRAARGILLPTTGTTGMNPVIAGRELLFTLPTGEVLRWSIPDDKSFNRGEKNLYTIRVNRTGLDVTSTIVDWTPGNGDGETGEAE